MKVEIRTKYFMRCTLVGIALLALSVPLQAQLPPPTHNDTDAFKEAKEFSPYAGRNFPTEVYWGDTHLHISQSMDAGAFSVNASAGLLFNRDVK